VLLESVLLAESSIVPDLQEISAITCFHCAAISLESRRLVIVQIEFIPTGGCE
jgi:hypothetical protein